MDNFILDYEQVQEKLNEMQKCKKIIKENDIGITKYGLPIEHYSIGTGEKEIVITGATHGCEIITTDFVLTLMQEMCKEENNNILSKYKMHFIPILNPEGYLISTSAIRKLIPRKMELNSAEQICKEYYLSYKSDDIEAKQQIKENKSVDRFTIKKHQLFFNGVDYNCIPNKYSQIKQSVKSIYEKYKDIPKFTLHTWSANADGIDIQANCEYNEKIQRILNGEIIYKDNYRQSNIDISHPGPVNCPFDKKDGFKIANENKAITCFLEELSKKNTLDGYYNYHSTGGLIYQRLPIDAEKIEKNVGIIWNRTVSNYVIAKLYEEKTYKNAHDKVNTRYTILKDGENISSINDVLKIKYPKDLLIELSGMGGNPLAPYGDIENNYCNLINSNIEAFKYSINKRAYAEKIYEVLADKVANMKYTDENVRNVYKFIDIMYNDAYNENNILVSNICKEKEVADENER